MVLTSRMEECVLKKAACFSSLVLLICMHTTQQPLSEKHWRTMLDIVTFAGSAAVFCPGNDSGGTDKGNYPHLFFINASCLLTCLLRSCLPVSLMRSIGKRLQRDRKIG